MRRRADIDRNVSGVVRSVHEDFRAGDRTGQVDRLCVVHTTSGQHVKVAVTSWFVVFEQETGTCETSL
jgi:hypothetical protein